MTKKDRLSGCILALVVVLGTQACAGPDPEPGQRDAGAGAAGAAGGAVHEYAYLEDSVEHLLEFLRGEVALQGERVADSVTLHVAPEGGGLTSRVAASDLEDPAAWRVGPYSFAPPEGYGHRTMTPGLHQNCYPVGLETRYPELARLPHVGVRLAPDEDAACLQTWNVTFVFNEDAEDPRLIGVVYDQWEW